MHDVVIIGGGHNGLVCSAYLAMAGHKAVVLEQRPIVGGAAVTEEFSPGFFNSTASYAVSLLNPKIIRDLDLAAHGLRIVERPIANFLPLEDGRFLQGRRQPNETGNREILGAGRGSSRRLSNTLGEGGGCFAPRRARDAAKCRRGKPFSRDRRVDQGR